MKEKLMLLFHKVLNIFHIKLNSKQEKLFFQIFTFIFVGGLAFIIDYLVLILCKELININIYISTALAFTVSVIFNYILSVKIVFDVKQNNNKNFIKFILYSILGLVITELIMWFGVNILKITYLIVKIVATLIVMVFNFITRKLFLERKK